MVEEIINNGSLLAIIVSHNYIEKGIHFFTSDDITQQLGYMNHAKGKIIEPHVHNPIPRQVNYTQEVLFIKNGKMRVDFYDEHQVYLKSRILEKEDVILLAHGGHGFEVLEDVEMFEVKQGPYVGENDKTRFKGNNINVGDDSL